MRERLDNVEKPAVFSRLFFPIIISLFFVFHVTPSFSRCRFSPPCLALSGGISPLMKIIRTLSRRGTNRGMILGRRSLLVKFAVELSRLRCQINRGKALLSRSNRQRGETRGRKRQSELGRDMSSFADRGSDTAAYEMYEMWNTMSILKPVERTRER